MLVKKRTEIVLTLKNKDLIVKDKLDLLVDINDNGEGVITLKVKIFKSKIV